MAVLFHFVLRLLVSFPSSGKNQPRRVPNASSHVVMSVCRGMSSFDDEERRAKYAAIVPKSATHGKVGFEFQYILLTEDMTSEGHWFFRLPLSSILSLVS